MNGSQARERNLQIDTATRIYSSVIGGFFNPDEDINSVQITEHIVGNRSNVRTKEGDKKLIAKAKVVVTAKGDVKAISDDYYLPIRTVSEIVSDELRRDIENALNTNRRHRREKLINGR